LQRERSPKTVGSRFALERGPLRLLVDCDCLWSIQCLIDVCLIAKYQHQSSYQLTVRFLLAIEIDRKNFLHRRTNCV
jgi:hypothetical protein